MAMRTTMAAFVGLVAVLFVASVLMVVSEEAEAVEYYGTSPPFSPGASWSLYVGYFGVGDILDWYWTTSDSLSFALMRTTDSTVYLYGFSDFDGYLVEVAGHYGLIWTNENWFFSATVTYGVAGYVPTLVVETPLDGAYLNSKTVTVQGTADAYASGVLVGPDALHLREADWEGNNWGIDGILLEEGQETILVRNYYVLDWYGYKNYTFDRVVHVTVDTCAPTVSITAPKDRATIHGDRVDIGWSCADECGIAKTEMKVDGWGWDTVEGTEYPDLHLPTGTHTVQIRVTDLAGNQGTDSITIGTDARALSFDGPYYGLPLIGIILGIVAAVAILVLMLRKRKGGPTVATAPPPQEPAPQTPP